MATLLEQLSSYQPCNEQEDADRREMLLLLQKESNLFTRENRQAHFTASAWIVNPARNRVLMVYHRIYDSWAWTGGHADGETDLLSVALREAREETGIAQVCPLSEAPFSIETLTVNGHEKRGAYVPCHLHLNVTYLLEAEDTQALHIKEDENKGARWFSLEDSLKKPTEKWMVERVYRKLNEKLKTWG